MHPAETVSVMDMPDRSDPEFWRGQLAMVPVNSRSGEANLVTALAHHILEERLLQMRRISRESAGRARRQFMNTYHCPLEWLLQWNEILEFLPDATNPYVLAGWLQVSLRTSQHSYPS